MTRNFVYLADNEAAVMQAAEEMAKQQLMQAASIVSAATGLDINEVDTSLVGAVMQALATNQLSIVMSRRDFFTA
jgi:hypothetical protein